MSWQMVPSKSFGCGKQLRPINCATRKILDSFKAVNPKFEYKPKYTPPKRILTNPSIPRHNEGNDNENYDLIMHVGDVLGSSTAGEQSVYCWKKNSRYTLIDMLGQGTFGQVVKCRDENTGKLVAVKVLKNKPAYFKQGLLEIGILTVMNTNADPTGERRTLRFLDHFLYRNHLCLVNELLSVNLYELIKQNGFHGVSANLIRVFTRQILDALIAMDDEAIIHCDLKPENILLQQVQGTDVTLIDFGSACFEKSTMYSYIQSRHYRSPEVILGLRYSCAIDMWSLGCIAAELFIGIPVFPGANEYNQLYKIIEMLGPPPPEMIRLGTRASKFFKPDLAHPGQFLFKSAGEYERDTGTHVDPDKKYFIYRNLPELTTKYPMKTGYDPSNTNPACQDKEIRRSFLHFLNGCLQIDPTKRWTPSQARAHPFINEEVLPENWVPPPPTRPIKKLKAPKMKDSSSRTQLDVNGAYHKFCVAMKHSQIIDVATNVLLTNLRTPLQPSFQEKPPQPPQPTRGNRSRSMSEARIPGISGRGPAPPVQQFAGKEQQQQPLSIMQLSQPTTPNDSCPSAGPPKISIQASIGPTSHSHQSQPVSIGGHSRKSSGDRTSSSANTMSSSAISARMMSKRLTAGKQQPQQRRAKKLVQFDSTQDSSGPQVFEMDIGSGTSAMSDTSPVQQSPRNQYQPAKVQVPQRNMDGVHYGSHFGPSGNRIRGAASSWNSRPSGIGSRTSGTTLSMHPPPPLLPEQPDGLRQETQHSQPQAIPKPPMIPLGESVPSTPLGRRDFMKPGGNKYSLTPRGGFGSQAFPPPHHSPDAMDST